MKAKLVQKVRDVDDDAGLGNCICRFKQAPSDSAWQQAGRQETLQCSS